MERLTYKKGVCYYPNSESWLIPDDGSNVARILQIIGKYEDLEQELGIDLITLFKALTGGIYSRDYGTLFVEHFCFYQKNQLHCKPTNRKELRFALKDYGKTWALTKEELEDEKEES